VIGDWVYELETALVHDESVSFQQDAGDGLEALRSGEPLQVDLAAFRNSLKTVNSLKLV
jgi:hypothetical protein